ncbi:RepB family plasmid replication initiator protein, partial [Acinetobacter sp. WU_MDCI_Abxa265]
DRAISEINKHTNITVDYDQFKKGRVITDIQFRIKSKDKPSQQELTKVSQTAFHQMTDAQINMFGNQLSRLPEFSNLANGNESYESLAAKIKEMLRDPIQQKQFLPHLKNLGFKA